MGWSVRLLAPLQSGEGAEQVLCVPRQILRLFSYIDILEARLELTERLLREVRLSVPPSNLTSAVVIA
jgi:hypothetical protein